MTNLDMFIGDLVGEFNVSPNFAQEVGKILFTTSINDAIRRINNLSLSERRTLNLHKFAIRGERRLVFFDTRFLNVKDINASNIDELFFIKYTNSNSVLDINRYSEIKNWDTEKNVQGYCTLLN